MRRGDRAVRGEHRIGTGDLPFHHGMIGNTWFNRETGKAQTCSEDAGITEVSYGAFKGSGDSASQSADTQNKSESKK